MEFTRITWQQLEKDCIALAKKIKHTPIDEIICISRGGLVVSRILSDLLDVKISNITLESYQNAKQEKEPRITQFLPETYKNEIILLVDEVSDTGKTFERAVSYLRTLPIRKIYTAAPYIKPHTTCIPDFWEISVDKWIIYPYEIRETKETFLTLFSEEEAVKKLKELGIEAWEQ
ncbi:MAG TPA: phosphoribosyltransferase family protein [Candidatus Saccharimonadales bacterium]|nr:phosphoribosyltransferase family protein [Candidatus Saccharimonadales bacterium]